MGNKILGKRSRSFYKGFNEKQIDYIKQKFDTMSTNGILDEKKFADAYKLNEYITKQFYSFVDFDQNSDIDQYEFICAVHTLCNMTVTQLSYQLFDMLVSKSNSESINEKQLQKFTQVCLKYNTYLQKKTITQEQIKKSNLKKFKKYDVDKNKSIDKQQFSKICTKDQDYKKWLFNMGFITKNQMQFHDQIYDLVDSDIQDQISKHLTQTNPNIDKIKRGIQHRIDDDQFQVVEQVGEQSLPGVSYQKKQPKVQKKPWQISVQKISFNNDDKNYSPIQLDKQNPRTPSQSLTIQYVFGYRSFDCRNNIKFDLQSNIIYHQGNLGIVMKKGKQNQPLSQTYINQHKDDIVCLELFGNLAITGQLGSTPAVMLWETNQNLSKEQNYLKPKMIITEKLIDSVVNITMSKSMKLLAVCCNNTEHRLVIYNYQTLKKLQQPENITSTQNAIVAFGNLGKSVILDIKFTINQKSLVAATLKQLLFVNFDKSTLKVTRGDFNSFSNSPSLCLLPFENKQNKKYILSGMANGSIYFWQDNKCTKAVCGHSGSVSALCHRKDVASFISGDKTGQIILWSSKFQKQLILTVTKTNSPSNMIISLSINNNKQLLIGTKSSKAYIISLSKANPSNQITQKDCIITGHSQGQIRALSVDQTQGKNIFYTGGQDNRLIKWQYGQINKLLIQKKLKYSIKSIDFNHIERILAVGYKNGIIQLFNQNLQQKGYQYNQIRNPDQQTLIFTKFSPNSKLLLASYTYVRKQNQQQQKYCLKIFEYNKQKKKLQIIKQIQQKNKIISADISSDYYNDKKNRQYIRLNTQKYQYFVYDITDQNVKKLSQNQIKNIIKKLIKQKKKQNGEERQERSYWANIFTTHSTILTPQTQGFKTQGVSQQDITCCQRSRQHGNVFVIGDRFSKIKLFNYPCKTYPLFNKYTGHSNQITAVQFNYKQDYLISVGGEQKSIIVWKYDPDEQNNKIYFDQIVKINSNQDDGTEKVSGDQKGITHALQIPKIPKGQIKQPSGFKSNPKKDNVLPNQSASIRHVFGLRNKYLADQIRNQCRFTSDFEHIVFPTACLGVKMNIETKKQSFYQQHKQDIVSFAVDNKRQLMATGQMAQKNAKQPKNKILSINVWDIKNNKILQTLKNYHTIAVVLLSFSPNSKLLFSVGNDQNNSFAVWNWRSKTILYQGPVSKGKVNGICWKSDNQFITVGNDHIKIWTDGKGKQVKLPGQAKKFQSMFSCSLFKNKFVSGSGKGNIFYMGEKELIKAHEGKVQTIYCQGQSMYTGGDDGNIFIWKQSNGKLQKQKKALVNSLQLIQSLNSDFGIQIKEDLASYISILSIDISPDNSFLISTAGSDVILYRRNSTLKSKPKSQILHTGHCIDELWGLTTCQQNNFIITGGDDKTVRLWDIQQMKEVKRIIFNDKIRGLDWFKNQQKNLVVIADQKARIHLYPYDLSKKYWSHQGKPFKLNAQQSTNKPFVEDIKFSPNGKYIVYGTHGKSRHYQLITLNQKDNDKNFLRNIRGGTSALLHIDWSRDSTMFAINTQAYEYRFHGIKGDQPRASSVRDQQWATWTRKIGFQSLGVFQQVDLTNVNTVCRHPSKSFLVAGYDDQTIKMFKYPTYIYKQAHKTFYGHSSHVTRVRFTNQFMVSVGGNDRTIIVWDLEGIKGQESTKQIYSNKNITSAEDQDDDGIDDIQEDVDLPVKAITRKNKKQKKQEFQVVEDQGDQFMAVKPWLGAIKQPTYKYPKALVDKPKNLQLKLQYVFGYRSKDCRQNLFYHIDQKKSMKIIFHAAACLIIHNISDNTQKILTHHNDDILSIDYHRKSGRILTGQLGPKPLLCFYQQQKFIKSFLAPVTKGIISVSISPSGLLGLCVGIDQDHHIALMDLQKGTVICKQKSGRKVVTKIKFISNKQFITIGINHFMYWEINDKNQIKKKTLAASKNHNNNFVSIDIYDDLLLVGSGNGQLHKCIKGQIVQKIQLKNQEKISKIQKQIKKRNQVNKKQVEKRNQQRNKQKKSNSDNQDSEDQKPFEQQPEQVKPGVVQCIKITQSFIACGTRQGQIYFLDKKKLKIIKIIDLTSRQLQFDHTSFNPAVRSIDFTKDNTKMIIGTLGSQIYEIQINNNFQIIQSKIKNILKCHYSPNNQWTNQVWGLTIVDNKIFTCSDDATIRYWNLNERKLISSISMLLGTNKDQNNNQQQNSSNVNVNKKNNIQTVSDDLRFRAIAIQPESKQFIVVGSKDGTVNIFRFDEEQDKDSIISFYKTFKPSNQQISQIKFGFNTLIIGSHDNAIYVYDYEVNGLNLRLKRKYKPMKKHSSYITHFDVSRDSCFLQSTCGAYELLFWDLSSGKQITSGATLLKDQRWSSWTCNLGWPVQGIYPKCTDGTFINSVDRSHFNIQGKKWKEDPLKHEYLAVGNDNGKVCVYNYPSLIKSSSFIQGKGHSSHVTKVKWSDDDKYIISTGGEDQCVMIWEVVKKKK